MPPPRSTPCPPLQSPSFAPRVISPSRNFGRANLTPNHQMNPFSSRVRASIVAITLLSIRNLEQNPCKSLSELETCRRRTRWFVWKVLTRRVFPVNFFRSPFSRFFFFTDFKSRLVTHHFVYLKNI